jgi:Pupal cuticle protein C1
VIQCTFLKFQSFLQFVAFFATLALANAGFIAEQPAAYSSLSYASPVKTLVQPVAYAADHHQQYHPAPASSSYTKTISYSQPKAYIAQPAVAHSYHSYEPEQHHYVAADNYHHEPEHHVYAAAPVHHYEHGSSEQNIVRSAHGTVSHISKAVDTPHSSVRKYDTRIINDGYKTVQYAQPAYIQPAVHSYAPLAKTVVAQPLVTKHLAQPVIAKTIAHVAQPAHYQYAAQPIQYAAQPIHYAAQPVQYSAQYATPQYAAHAPVLASKVHYSPAIEVAHASFESPDAHYSW